MVISSIQPQAANGGVDLRVRAANEYPSTTAPQQVAAQPTNSVDQVSLGQGVDNFQAEDLLIERVLNRLEAETRTTSRQDANQPSPITTRQSQAPAPSATINESPLVANTAAQAQSSQDTTATQDVQSPQTDFTPQDVAARITAGVTESIFEGFRANNPDFSEADLIELRDQVTQGLERGLEDARDILTGLGQLSPERNQLIEQTGTLVRGELANFFEQQLAEVQGEVVPTPPSTVENIELPPIPSELKEPSPLPPTSAGQQGSPLAELVNG